MPEPRAIIVPPNARYGARTSALGRGKTILVEQTIWKADTKNPKGPGRYVCDMNGKKPRSRHVRVTDPAGIGQAVLDAHAGKL